MRKFRSYPAILTAVLLMALACLFPCRTEAQERKVMNRPYIDTRKWHYGFLFGFHLQDMDIANNGYVYSDGDSPEVWYADVSDYSPGFSVGVLGEWKINDWLSLRLVPTLHFGDKSIIFRDWNSGQETKQLMKSTYLSVPLDLKVSAPRFNNFRPYVMAGFSPMADLTVKEEKEMLVNRFDGMLEVGIGLDLYYPYFKFVPELKFCFGLSDILVRDRSDLVDKTLLKYTESINSAHNRMIVLTFYFE